MIEQTYRKMFQSVVIIDMRMNQRINVMEFFKNYGSQAKNWVGKSFFAGLRIVKTF